MKKILSLLSLGLVFGYVPLASGDIVIGVAGPFTGQYATFGQQLQDGVKQAVADINAAGGVLGEKLDLKFGDDACDPKQAVAVANQFVGMDTKFVVGHFCSGSSIPASSVYGEEQIIEISPASTNPKFTDERPSSGIYRVCGRDDQQGAVAGNFIANNFADKNIALIHDKTAYGKGLATETKKYMNAEGKQEKLYEAFTAGEKDYTALVSKLKLNKIDILYIGGYHTEAGLIARQLRDQGMDTIVISGDALVTNEYWAITGDAGQGTLMTFPPDPRKRDQKETKELIKKFRANGVEPEGYVLYSYAAVQVWKAAVEAAGSLDYAKVNASLDKGKFETVIGEISFDDKGDVDLPGYVFYQWKDGDYDYYQQ